MDFRGSKVTELADQVRRGERSAVELCQMSLDRIAEVDSEVNAFVAVDAALALEQAAAVDQVVASGGDPGPLAGIPIGVKDLEDALGFPTTHGSPLFEDAVVAHADSPLVARLRRAGCVVVGKTNTPEFGWTSRTENALHGLTRNPWNLDHSPGGSSGGSAAAIAAGMVPLATGSDGGGSIRIPSAACGLSGMKASLGRVPTGGAEPPGWLELSSKGPMAASIRDVAAALDVAIGPEQSDLASLPRPDAPLRDAVADPHLPAVVGWSPDHGWSEVDSEVRSACEAAVSAIADAGIEVVEIPRLFDGDCVDDWFGIVCACLARSMEALSDHHRFEEVDPVLRMLVERGRSATGIDVVRALDAAHLLNLRLVEAFHDVRLILSPTTAGVAPPVDLDGVGLLNGRQDPNWVRFTYVFNMTRSPAATVPVGLSSAGIPIGLQIVGPQHADHAVLRAAAAVEDLIGFDAVAQI